MLMFNDRDGSGKLLTWLQGPVPLTTVFPSFLLPDWRAQWPAVAVVVGGCVLGVCALWLAGRRAGEERPASPHLALLLISASAIGVAVAGRVALSRSAATAMVRDGQLALLERWLPARAFDVLRWTPLSERTLLDRIHVPLYVAPGEVPEDPRTWLGPWQIPPGTYALRIWLLSPRGDAGEFFASFHRTSAVAARADAVGVPVVLPLELPMDLEVPPVWIGASSQALTTQVTRVELLAEAVATAAAQRREPVRALENIDGRPGAYLAYLDRDAFPENGVFWTRGESETRVALTTGGPKALRLAVETGAAGGTAALDVDGVPAIRELPPRTVENVDVVPRPGRHTIWLRVKFSAGFRPSEAEGSTDRRWLGLRVRPLLR
jgi:hypothetical protein